MLHIIKQERRRSLGVGPGIRLTFATACACIHADMYDCMRAHAAKKWGEPTWLPRTTGARCAPAQKVHCIYKSFIMNYTMVYLKWEACLVHGYMGYRDYNACSGGRERGERDPRLQEAADSRATARYRVGVFSLFLCACVYPTCAHAHVIIRAHTRLQIDIAGRMPAPE